MIKKRNLDPSLIQWVMSQTGLGPGVGELHWVAPASSSSSQYRTQLQRWGVEQNYEIHTLPSAAFAKMVASRNDVMLIMPGAYAETTELAWNKSNTHALGLGGPKSWSDYSEPGVSIYTVSEVAETVDLTGNYCQFHGINFTNNGAYTAALAAFNVDGYMAQFSGCSFHGVMNSTQDGVAAAAALYIDSLGSSYVFEDCIIGDNNWTTRTDANSGQLRYVGTTAWPSPQNGLFRRCAFRVKSETSTVSLVALPHANCMDRDHTFDQCTFSNFRLNWAGDLSRVFYALSSHQTTQILLKDCMSVGYTEYQDTNMGEMFMTNNPLAAATGGLGIEATGS